MGKSCSASRGAMASTAVASNGRRKWPDNEHRQAEKGAHHTTKACKTEGGAALRRESVVSLLLGSKHRADNLAAASHRILADQLFFYRDLFKQPV